MRKSFALLLVTLTLLVQGSIWAQSQTSSLTVTQSSVDQIKSEWKKMKQWRDQHENNTLDTSTFKTNEKGALRKIRDAVDALKKEVEVKPSAKAFDTQVSRLEEFFSGKATRKKDDISVGIKTVQSAFDEALKGLAADYELATGTPTPTPTPTPAPLTLEGLDQKLNHSSDKFLMLSVALMIASLVIISLTAWWLKGRITQVRDGLNMRLKQGDLQRQEFAAHLQSLHGESQNQLRQLSTLSTGLHTLHAEVTNLRASVQAAQSAPVINRPRPEPAYAASAPEPAFVSVNDYLRRVAGNSHRAKHALIPPDALQKSTGDDAPYVIAANGRSGFHEVIPSYARFTSSQDFAHYQKFYDCEQPSAGEVFIVEPALAAYDAASGQYHLKRKGRLQIG